MNEVRSAEQAQLKFVASLVEYDRGVAYPQPPTGSVGLFVVLLTWRYAYGGLSLILRPRPLTRKNSLVNQIKLSWAKAHFCNLNVQDTL